MANSQSVPAPEKKRGPAVRANPKQREMLVAAYQEFGCNVLVAERLAALSSETGLTTTWIKSWVARYKKAQQPQTVRVKNEQKEEEEEEARELLSSPVQAATVKREASLEPQLDVGDSLPPNKRRRLEENETLTTLIGSSRASSPLAAPAQVPARTTLPASREILPPPIKHLLDLEQQEQHQQAREFSPQASDQNTLPNGQPILRPPTVNLQHQAQQQHLHPFATSNYEWQQNRNENYLETPYRNVVHPGDAVNLYPAPTRTYQHQHQQYHHAYAGGVNFYPAAGRPYQHQQYYHAHTGTAPYPHAPNRAYEHQYQQYHHPYPRLAPMPANQNLAPPGPPLLLHRPGSQNTVHSQTPWRSNADFSNIDPSLRPPQQPQQKLDSSPSPFVNNVPASQAEVQVEPVPLSLSRPHDENTPFRVLKSPFEYPASAKRSHSPHNNTLASTFTSNTTATAGGSNNSSSDDELLFRSMLNLPPSPKDGSSNTSLGTPNDNTGTIDLAAATFKHLSVLRVKEGKTLSESEMFDRLLDENLAKNDPFQAAMGLVFMSRRGLRWDYSS